MLTKLGLIALLVVVAAQTESAIVWCFIAVPLVYLIWRLDLNGNRS